LRLRQFSSKQEEISLDCPDNHRHFRADVTDLLADLLHYCKATHIDFAAMLAIAQEIFDDEVKQDP
jgi:hypothetical protein